MSIAIYTARDIPGYSDFADATHRIPHIHHPDYPKIAAIVYGAADWKTF